MITQKLLKEIFKYENGNLIRNYDSGGSKAGTAAGWVNTVTRGKKYIRISVKRNHIYLHQAIFLYHHGYLPKYIDHIDGDGTNNRIENLRETTQSQNLMNVPGRKGTKSGIKNVYWHAKLKKWTVQVKVGDKGKHFGLYDDIELAELVAIEVRNKYHKQFANHNVRTL